MGPTVNLDAAEKIECFVQSVACSLCLPHFPTSIHLRGGRVYTQ